MDELEKQALEIYEYTTCHIPDDLSVLPEIGSNLSVFISRTGKLLSDAKLIQNKALKIVLLELTEKKLSPSITKELAYASCERENYLVDLIERLNRTCTHQLDWVRTLISKGKEEMRLSNYQKI
jgi:hypothetical protein